MEKHEKMPSSHVETGKTCGFIPGLERWRKAFHLHSFIKRLEKRPFKHFSVNCIKQLTSKR